MKDPAVICRLIFWGRVSGASYRAGMQIGWMPWVRWGLRVVLRSWALRGRVRGAGSWTRRLSILERNCRGWRG
ncbi:hypothetical protein I7I53_05109 [Histoplasma capsulatum var. duboisii H88]|uniref:Uncharacterized protein n=1 Tax=Ajellomyces capsulatus (strain H88) TaxID=544711 RepID=A0A8A1LSP5_AJEC8|nr:hypothetical protein I7I53_05109 [Histoplasma capsulatum var. duboisii H88]